MKTRTAPPSFVRLFSRVGLPWWHHTNTFCPTMPHSEFWRNDWRYAFISEWTFVDHDQDSNPAHQSEHNRRLPWSLPQSPRRCSAFDLYFRNLSAIMDSFPPVTTTFFHSGMNMLGARVVHERPAARAHQNAHRTEWPPQHRSPIDIKWLGREPPVRIKV